MNGLPTMIGKTQYFNLALTTVYADSQDLYAENIDGDYYILNGDRVKLKQRN